MLTNENIKEDKDKEAKKPQSKDYVSAAFTKFDDQATHIKNSIIDRELGTLRSIFFKIKMFFINISRYIKSFFTQKKLNEIKAVFAYDKYSQSTVETNRDELKH